MMPRLLHRIWLGDPARYLPRFDGFWDRWRELHPGWTTVTWTDCLEVDDSRDPEPLLTQNLRDMWESYESPVIRSDLLRLVVLLRYGGVYVDVDVEPRKNIEPVVDAAERPTLMGWEFWGAPKSRLRPQNCFIASQPGAEFIAAAIQTALGNLNHALHSPRSPAVTQSTGPRMLKQAMRLAPGTVHIWQRPQDLVLGNPSSTHHQGRSRDGSTLRDDVDLSEAYVVHHAAGTWG